MGGEAPSADCPLTEKGRSDAIALGARLAGRSASAIVWTSPERRASETAALAFRGVVADVRDQLSEVKKPWYPSVDELTDAVVKYLRDEHVNGWEPHEDVITRISQLKLGFGSPEGLVLVSHGLLLTSWILHELRLPDPFSFWSDLRMPDAWEFDLDKMSLDRIL